MAGVRAFSRFRLDWRKAERPLLTVIVYLQRKPLTQRVGASEAHLAAHAVTLRIDASDP